MPEPLWVAQLVISDRTAHKLRTRHGLDPEEVRDALVCVKGLRYVWANHPERGRRAIVEARLRGRVVAVVLYPVDDPHGGVFALGSAYPR
ncbi:MAG TPA: hypothetical protein VMV17_25815 [Streptosporangiaceae bacterium]|nr:hypothetical protein [Streptosporangiaceae bacterium]